MFEYTCPNCQNQITLLSEDLYNRYKDKPCYDCTQKLKEQDCKEPNPQKEYKKRCWELTEQQNLSSLENSNLRSFNGYHLDHIVPIYQGYKLDISPKKIASLENLQFIPKEENLNKGFKLTNKAKELLKQWNCTR